MEEAFQVANASLADVQQALADGRTSSTALTQAYLARIATYDRAGPSLNSVREANPDALAIATLADGQKPLNRCPLAGIPILVKDNIATADDLHTTPVPLPSTLREPGRMLPSFASCYAPPAR